MQEIQETWLRSLTQEDSPEVGNGTPLQYSCLENSMGRGAWWDTVHGTAESWTWLNDRAHIHLQFIEHYIKSFPVILPTTDIELKIFFPFCWVKESSILLLWFQLPCLLVRFEHLYRAIYISSFVNCPFLSLAHFSTWSFVFLLLICRNCSLYCLEFIEVYFVTHYLINLSLCCVSIWGKKGIPCSNSI